MEKINILDIYHNKINFNKNIIISGWVRSCRHSKLGISFLQIYDGSCFHSIQVIVKKNIIKNYKEKILKLHVGCSMIIHGILIKSIGKKQFFEILSNKINIIGLVNNPNKYPISPKKHTLKYLRIYSHLRPRTNIIGAVTRIRNILFYNIHSFLFKLGYYWIPTPIITCLNAEGGGDMFNVFFNKLNNKKLYKQNDFFKKKTYLTVSGQLTLESYACALSKVYSFGPVFRAENSNTRRHLAEFWMLEIEKSFSNLYDLIILSEKFIKYLIKIVLKKCCNELDFLKSKIDSDIYNRLNKILLKKFIIISYDEAVKILLNKKIIINDNKNKFINITNDQEKYLVDNYFKFPIFIINSPKEIKSFYMRINKDKKTVASMDLLFPGIGEILGGSEREERLNKLDKSILFFNLKIKDYYWYRDLRKYGTVPHSGFGIGFERLISYITGIKNIKDIIPFPRTVNNINF